MGAMETAWKNFMGFDFPGENHMEAEMFKAGFVAGQESMVGPTNMIGNLAKIATLKLNPGEILVIQYPEDIDFNDHIILQKVVNHAMEKMGLKNAVAFLPDSVNLASLTKLAPNAEGQK